MITSVGLPENSLVLKGRTKENCRFSFHNASQQQGALIKQMHTNKCVHRCEGLCYCWSSIQHDASTYLDVLLHVPICRSSYSNTNPFAYCAFAGYCFVFCCVCICCLQTHLFLYNSLVQAQSKEEAINRHVSLPVVHECLSVCVCVCICICIYVHVCACTSMYVHVSVCMHMHLHMSACERVHYELYCGAVMGP